MDKYEKIINENEWWVAAQKLAELCRLKDDIISCYELGIYKAKGDKND